MALLAMVECLAGVGAPKEQERSSRKRSG
jgi:hypothetical protein